MKKLSLILIILVTLIHSSSTPDPIYFYATQSGKVTLDQGADGGNPFASVFIELLGYESLTVKNFNTKLINLTLQKSKNFQKPEITFGNSDETLFVPKQKNEKWIALVIVFSQYSNHRASSLLGAKNDFVKVSNALIETGFDVLAVIDPGKQILDDTLKTFASFSKHYDRAVIYTTGHGFENNTITYLIRGDYPYSYSETRIDEYAIPLKRLGDTLNAKKLNLLFYGGCRNQIF